MILDTGVNETKSQVGGALVVVRGSIFCAALFCAYAASASGQSGSVPIVPAQSVTVTSSAEPLPLGDFDRSTRVFDLTEASSFTLYDSVEDFLRLDPSIDLQERAGGGVQADISIRGTTFEQSLVLVDGLRLNDPETGHLNLDLPLPLDGVSRIDVLHGSGSTFYGSDAIGGAVNLITQAPTRSEIALKVGGGTFNATEQHLRADWLSQGHGLLNGERFTGARDTSDGFFYQTPGGAYENDRGYHANTVASDTFLNTVAGPAEIILGASDRPYGANLFYGDYDSKERTKGWFGAVRQSFADNVTADFAYARHTDEFILLASAPSVYENNHIATSWQSDLRQTHPFARNIDLAYGLEADGESILSNSLGHHARNQGAGYIHLSLHALKRLSLSLGVREEIDRGPLQVFSPSVAGSYRVSDSLRAHAAYGHGFRLPTYVDLYYSDPATIGNPLLKPETSQSYEAGLDYSPLAHPHLHATATAFRLHQANAIDYVKAAATPTAPWQALNIGRVDYTGAESTVSLATATSQHLDLGYTFIHANLLPAGLISEYAYNFAAQSASLSYAVVIRHQLSARTQLGVIQKTTQSPYPLWNVALSRSQGRVRPYLMLNNLSNTAYYEVAGPPAVPMPGRNFITGMLFTWGVTR
jgi:iron complex outermembrane receptor protein